MRPHPFTRRILCTGFFALLAALLLSGCGGGKPASSGAERYLKQARENEDMAISFEQKGNETEALAMYKEAMSKIETGLKTAYPNERPSLHTVKERIEPKIAEFQMRARLRAEREEADRKKAEEERKVAELTKKDEIKESAAKKKAEEDAKRTEKEKEEREAFLKKRLEAGSVKGTTKGGEDGDQEGAPTAAETANKKDDAPKDPASPFKVYEGKVKPRLTVDRSEERRVGKEC
jgi:hypothetical protein